MFMTQTTTFKLYNTNNSMIDITNDERIEMGKKYLFFDIESIDRRSKYICTFGYVLTDEKFNILHKEDMLINPDVIEYDWYVLKTMFHYTKETAISSPTFAEVFDKISGLVENDDIVVMGYAIVNDLDYLRNDYDRLGYDTSRLYGYDIQLFYKQINSLINGMKLFNLAKSFGIDTSKYIEHKSDDDAEVSMLIAKHYCDTMNLTIEEFISKYDILVRPSARKVRPVKQA
jgi:DNA polymerase III alpha subunit (gram-positive type)